VLNDTQVREAIGATAYDVDGQKVGKVGQVYMDDETGQPEFATVNTGMFGTSESFVPLHEATFQGDRLTLPYSKDKIKDAPNVDLDGRHLDRDEERRLYEYYGRSYGEWDGGTMNSSGNGSLNGSRNGSEGGDVSGPETDTAMTRSEEHLRAGTAEEEAGRVRLRKYVTTETETETVPVRKERAVVEREPVDQSNLDQALDGPAISEEEHEVVLHEERAVADTVAEPVERVRLGTETVQEEETVTGQVRKEHIETEGDVDAR
jgi:uncharacterized protein (TIGR02271 family)